MEKTVQEQALYQRLTEIVGSENVVTDNQTASYEVDGLVPNAIVFASTTEQVSQIVKAGNQFRTPIIPWGGGSKQQVGPCLAAADVVLCLKHMNQIVELDVSNFTVQVEAGIASGELQRQLTEHRLFFPFDPPYMETSTIGGALAANASGPLRAAYGTARDLVLGLTVVTPTGDIVHTGGKTMKNVAGIDLCKMFIGSWGTLGIITEAILRLFPLPEASKSLCLTFSDIEDAFPVVSQLLNSVLSPSAVELIDGIAGRNLGDTHGSSLKEDEVLLLVDIAGSIETVERHRKEINTIVEANKVCNIVTLEGEEATRLWNAYRGVHQSILSAVPSTLQGKASVPLSRLGNMFKAVKEVGNKYSVEIGIRAHCYNGILYPYVASGDDAINIIGDLRQAAADLGGFFTVEYAPLSARKNVEVWPHRNDYTLMKRLKTELDPNNILNSGRVVGGLY